MWARHTGLVLTISNERSAIGIKMMQVGSFDDDAKFAEGMLTQARFRAVMQPLPR